MKISVNFLTSNNFKESAMKLTQNYEYKFEISENDNNLFLSYGFEYCKDKNIDMYNFSLNDFLQKFLSFG